MEFKQNWHKFNQLLGPLPPSKSGMLALHSGQKIVTGVVCGDPSVAVKPYFRAEQATFENVEQNWEMLSHKYGSQWGAFLERSTVMEALIEVGAIQSQGPATENFYNQVRQLRSKLHLDPRDRGNQTFGSREFSMPRDHFFLSYFRSFFSDLLPEKKLLLMGVVNSSTSIDTVLLEFQGRELSNFYDPDFTGLEFIEKDLFERSNLSRLVLWCENQAMLPAYALIVSRKVWQECKELQESQDSRAAWSHLLRSKRQKDTDLEVIFEPEPWPIKALFHWHAWKKSI